MSVRDAVEEALMLAARDLRNDMDERAAQRVEEFAKEHLIMRYPERPYYCGGGPSDVGSHHAPHRVPWPASWGPRPDNCPTECSGNPNF